MTSKASSSKGQIKKSRYSSFAKINGEHPLKEAVPAIYVGYDAFCRQGGQVFYFNFDLAKEIGLISTKHDNQLNDELETAILDTFALQIINEFDVLNNVKIDKDLRKKNQYMATRYLQLQHTNKQGKTSGDGRSIWNGCLQTRKGIFDISSCGTGATRLSPASANEQRFFKTGDKDVSYGCGLADMSEGLTSAIFSEILHREGLKTERTLAVIQFRSGIAINVRVGENLLRPAHFFGFLKRNNFVALKQVADYYINRERENGNFPELNKGDDVYDVMLSVIVKRFAEAAAKFESEYIFCWMDWDGDNILMDGGIIDYGTVRQFGLFHHQYRYEDVDKMSTTITEQKNKARLIIQTFAQLVDYLQTGTKKNKKAFRSHWSQDLFNQAFQLVMLKQTLIRMGFQSFQLSPILLNETCFELVKKFQRQYRYFERAVAGRKEYPVADGIMRDSIFCMRDFMREFPKFYIEQKRLMSTDEFIEIVSSDYASRIDKSKYRRQSKRIENLQRIYLSIVEQACEGFQISLNMMLKEISSRSSIINREDKLTGNGVIYLTEKIMKEKSQLTQQDVQSLIAAIVEDNTLNPDFSFNSPVKLNRSEKVEKLLKWSQRKRSTLKSTI